MQSNLNFQNPFTKAVSFTYVKIYGKKSNQKDWQMNMVPAKISVLSYVTLQPLHFCHLQKYHQLSIKLKLYYLKMQQESLNTLKPTMYMEGSEILDIDHVVQHHYSHLNYGQ